MLLLHQVGSVKIGEVVRYSITYTPATDRILPPPSHLYLKIRNTSTVALRAAFIHGPYTLYVSAAPSTFNPNERFANPRRDGVPQFEPNLKAGGTWFSKLAVPNDIRDTAGSAEARDGGHQKSVSWVVEIASQVIFSNSASVHYEVLLGRDKQSLSLGMMGAASQQGLPGQISDHQQSKGAEDGHHAVQPKGVFSRAISVVVDDTASLWNKPSFPEWDEAKEQEAVARGSHAPTDAAKPTEAAQPSASRRHTLSGKRRKKVHLVVLTHGLHSNLGSDMLYLKESIDEASRQAKKDAHRRKQEEQNAKCHDSYDPGNVQEATVDSDQDGDENEEVIVRGFSGNAVRTEKGIKYLGKRLAKYVLNMTFPDQPFKPVARSATQSMMAALNIEKESKSEHGTPVHANSSIREESNTQPKLAYKITSISFISHSLGGLVQTYAVAYIQKHSPRFFDCIRPINFVALATPFLGLSNENPLYVKFALDFGLVGRTGQDLGLTWRPPTLAKGGWNALIGGLSESAHKKLEHERDPGAKPLLRILPTGPAHTALKKFRNRTVYSNVVNDGIVPLRTSCLLFLDWSGLERVEKARRDNGLVGTMANWGWSELTGANATANVKSWQDHSENDGGGIYDDKLQDNSGVVPQPPDDATEDDARSVRTPTKVRKSSLIRSADGSPQRLARESVTENNSGALDSILGFFKSNPSSESHKHSPKHTKIYQRSQTIKMSNDDISDITSNEGQATNGESCSNTRPLSAPPKTTFFESAGDLLAPPIPPVEFLIDPAARPRTIFHDRVYHPDDIPPPPLKSRSTSMLSPRRKSSALTTDSSSSNLATSAEEQKQVDTSSLKVEEKIARAYHRDLSWRKVLVRLEPDAHNNMIVRRRFANAYGWPVVKHLVDTHFGDSAAAKTRDENESNVDRAKDRHDAPNTNGQESHGQGQIDAAAGELTAQSNQETLSPSGERSEANDDVPPLNSLRPGNLARVLDAANESATVNETMAGHSRPRYQERQDSAQWSDRDFADSDGDSDMEGQPGQRKHMSSNWNWTEAIVGKGLASPHGTKKEDIDSFLAQGTPSRTNKNK